MALIVVIAGGVLLFKSQSGSASPVKPVPHAEQDYLSAVRSDLPHETTSSADLLSYGRLVCATYSDGDDPTQRTKALDRPDLVTDAATRSQLYGEALNHLCPQFQLQGLQPPKPLLPTPTTTPSQTTPSVSIVGP